MKDILCLTSLNRKHQCSALELKFLIYAPSMSDLIQITRPLKLSNTTDELHNRNKVHITSPPSDLTAIKI